MKYLVLLVALLSLAACNKGLKKSQKNSSSLPSEQLSVPKSGEEIDFDSEYHTIRGYSCFLEIPGSTLPVFIEPLDVEGKTKYKFHLAVNNEANKAILSQLDFESIIDASKDGELLKGLGFSKQQIKKIKSQKAESIKVSSEIYFDEPEMTGHMVRRSNAKNADGKSIKKHSQNLSNLTGCEESELEVEIENEQSKLNE